VVGHVDRNFSCVRSSANSALRVCIAVYEPTLLLVAPISCTYCMFIHVQISCTALGGERREAKAAPCVSRVPAVTTRPSSVSVKCFQLSSYIASYY